MPPKAPVVIISKAITLWDEDTSIVESKKSLDLQVDTMKELREIVNYINNNT